MVPLMRVSVAFSFAALLTGFAIQPANGEIPKPTDAPQPLSPAESAERFKVPEGFRLDLVASEPLIHEPSGVCWDARGGCLSASCTATTSRDRLISKS